MSKTAVLGLLERTTDGKPSRVRLKVMRGIKVRDLDPEVRANIESGSEVFTDAHPSYYKLGDEYTHKVIDHAISYVNGKVHTNGLENFWSLLKRALKGTYVNVEPFHLFRYLDEQAFRFNSARMRMATRGVSFWRWKALSEKESNMRSSLRQKAVMAPVRRKRRGKRRMLQ